MEFVVLSSTFALSKEKSFDTNRKRYKIRLNSTTMEGMNYLSPADVVMMTKHNNSRGMAATGIGLAAGLGGGALLFGIAGWLGLNAASKARARGAEQLALANQNAINNVSALLLQERASREGWQNQHAPTMTQYVDVRAGAGAGANALAAAYAANGINSAVGHDSFLRVVRYSAPQPCGCDTATTTTT